MKAIVFTSYGSPDGLQLQEVAKPTPKDNQVLIKIHATSVTAGDCEIRGLTFAFWIALPMRLFIGFTKPKANTILGQEFAGEVEAIGKDVMQFKIGDAVFGGAGLNFGSYAEYICVSSKETLVTKPANMTYAEAATTTTGGLEALHFMRKAALQKGQKILINGAGGSIGSFAIQIAKHFGAEVTAVDSTSKLEMMRWIGADKVIDYTKEDFTQNGELYDVIFDVPGKSPFSGSLKSLKPNGRYLLGNFSITKVFRALWTSMTGSKKVIIGAAMQSTEELNALKTLIEAGHVKSVIDRRYPLEETAEAHRYVDTGQKKGNLAIIVVPDNA